MPKNYIEEIRKAKGLTQEQLAERVGYEPATVQRHEKGKRGGKNGLRWETIQRYANALEVHPSDITDGPVAPETELEREILQDLRGLSEGEKTMFAHTLRSFAEKQKDQQNFKHKEEPTTQKKKGKTQ